MRRPPLPHTPLVCVFFVVGWTVVACQTPTSSTIRSTSSVPPSTSWDTLLHEGAAIAQHTTQPSPQTLTPQPDEDDVVFTSSTPRTSPYVLRGIDCFGPKDPKTCDSLRANLNLRVGDLIPFGWTGASTAQSLRAQSKLAFVSISPVFYPDGTAYITLDALSSEQHRTLTPPKRTWRPVVQSSPLLETYAAYSNAHLKLSKNGETLTPNTQGGFWNYTHHILAPYIALFRSEVPSFQDELTRIATYEREPSYRRAAAGLLGFATDDTTSAQTLSSLLLDPDQAVRNEAARALLPKLQRAAHNGTTIINPQPVLRMLRLPSPSDRTRAAQLLHELVRVPSLRTATLQQSFPVLAMMVHAKRPGLSKMALKILKSATKQDHGTDIQAWQNTVLSL